MHVVGIVLLLAALASALYGVSEWRKGRRVLKTPFRRTGELARRSATGDDISCEGMIQRCAPATAPCSGQPCVYYEIEVVQLWSKTVMTDVGPKNVMGTTRLEVQRSGEVFQLDDGSGPIAVDPRAGMEVELVTSHEEESCIAYGHLQAGLFEAQIPPLAHGKRGRGVRIIEKIIPMEGRLYVAGKLDADRVIHGPLLASRHGRDVLAMDAKRHILTGVVGAFLLFPSLALLLTEPAGDPCAIGDEAHEVCAGRIVDDEGALAKLTVTQPGSFTVSAGNARAWIAINDSFARPLARNAPGGVTVDLVPGTYLIRVNDSTPGHAQMVSGGLPYQLTVARSAAVALASF